MGNAWLQERLVKRVKEKCVSEGKMGEESGGKMGEESEEKMDHSGNSLYRMDKILDMKYLRKKKYYLIRWLGYENEPTWEPAANVRNDAASKKDITDFMATYQPQ